eukprot:jgi/Hompol1/1361/HPOL_002694-RA
MSRPLTSVMNSASKVVFTKDWQLVREEIRLAHIFNRINELKSENLWSLRQIKPHHPPPQPRTHRDYLLEEMASPSVVHYSFRWMYTDFKQERKWKKAMAFRFALWVLEWHQAADKSTVCIKRRAIVHLTDQTIELRSAESAHEQAILQAASVTPEIVNTIQNGISPSRTIPSNVEMAQAPTEQQNTTIAQNQAAATTATAEDDDDMLNTYVLADDGTSIFSSSSDSASNPVLKHIDTLSSDKRGASSTVPSRTRDLTLADQHSAAGTSFAEPASASARSLVLDTQHALRDPSKLVDQQSVAPMAIEPSSAGIFPPTTKRVTMNMESCVFFIEDDDTTDHALPLLPTLQPPQFDEKPVVPNIDLITPVSRFSLFNVKIKEASRWDEWGRLRDTVKTSSPVKWLPFTARYNTLKREPGLFEGDIQGPDGQPVGKPAIATPHTARTSNPKILPPWSHDEDDALWSFAAYYGHNWELTASSLNGMRLGLMQNRSEWDCYDRYVALASQDFKPSSMRADYLFAPPVRSGKSTMNDHKMKALKLLSTFEFVKRCSKHRESQRAKAAAVKTNKYNVNLVGHETHQQALAQAGVDTTQPALSPLELSIQKERRERVMQEQQRQALFASSHQRPGMAMGMGMGVNMGMVKDEVDTPTSSSQVNAGRSTATAKGSSTKESKKKSALTVSTTASTPTPGADAETDNTTPVSSKPTSFYLATTGRRVTGAAAISAAAADAARKARQQRIDLKQRKKAEAASNADADGAAPTEAAEAAGPSAASTSNDAGASLTSKVALSSSTSSATLGTGASIPAAGDSETPLSKGRRKSKGSLPMLVSSTVPASATTLSEPASSAATLTTATPATISASGTSAIVATAAAATPRPRGRPPRRKPTKKEPINAGDADGHEAVGDEEGEDELEEDDTADDVDGHLRKSDTPRSAATRSSQRIEILASAASANADANTNADADDDNADSDEHDESDDHEESETKTKTPSSRTRMATSGGTGNSATSGRGSRPAPQDDDDDVANTKSRKKAKGRSKAK